MNRSLYEKSKIVMLVLVLAVISNPLFAQDTLIYVNYDWSAKPVVYNIDTTALKDEHEIYLFNKKGYEFGYDATLNDQLVMFELKHCVIKVNSDDAIERNNKVYIPKQSGSVVVKQKARVIKKNGKVIELNESNIKQSIDEETQKGYNYFAIDNIEKGDQIEYMYIVKKTPELTGDCVYMQSSIPRLNSTLELLAPVNLILNFKSYNNFPVLLPDTSYSNKNYWKASLHYIEGLEKEEMASYYPNLMQVVFKLKDNLSKGTKDVISYSNVANNLYQVMYVNTTKSALANIKKMLKKINISATPSTAQKIRTIEDYIKLTYFKVDGNQSALDDLDFILENHKASTQGLTALFVSTLSAAGINHELVYTCSRSDYTFDAKFEAYVFLQDYVIYFPEIDLYLEPASLTSRLGFINPYYTNNNGFFVKRIKLGEFESAVGKIKFISPIKCDLSDDKLILDVKIDEENDALKIHLEHQMNGYSANEVQLMYDLLNEEQKKELNKELVTSLISNAEPENTKLLNTSPKDFGVLPLTVTTDFVSEDLIEKTGTKYLIKVGLLIGPQMELYNKEKRKLPVMNRFNRRYIREITFNIPAGYEIKNVESLKMNVVDSDQKMAAFISEYKIEGDVLTIKIDEYYKKIDYTVAEYEAFRAVINASADFNKKTLFLEKK